MEEELNEDELEERLYAMIHYADESQTNVDPTTQNESISDISANPPRSTVRRYWRTSGDSAPTNTHYQKVNNHSKDASTPQNNKTINKPNNTHLQKVGTPLKQITTPQKQITAPQKQITTPLKPITAPQKQITNSQNTISTIRVTAEPKEEKDEAPKSPKQTVTDLALFFSSPITSDTKTTVKILDNDDSHRVVELETSDEDEVIEVALPPKPIISIESSDEDEISIVTPQQSQTEIKKSLNKRDQQKNGKQVAERDRDNSTSPVPSVVSSVSDEFIRGDCIALNISSHQPEHHDFDFSLHGSDLIDTPSRKKKKKKNKDRENTTPVTQNAAPGKTIPKASEECFATPKSKSKNKKKTKSYAITAVPNPDIYDSDSNQSFDASKKENTYKVSEKSLPSVDVYESDSSQQSEIIKTNIETVKEKSSSDVDRSDSSISLAEKQPEVEPKKTINISTGAAVLAYAYKQLGKKPKSQSGSSEVVDLTDEVTTINDSNIEENIVMANVTGFEESDDYGEVQHIPQNMNAVLGSSREPAILSADLDFDNLKGKEKVCKKRWLSLATLQAEMEKFYNESWGGEDFNHQEIQKTMSRDKSLWAIDPKDKIPYYTNRRKVTCNYCNRVGHRDDACRMKPSVCHMCGNTGHHEPRCPNKICVNCGSPNYMYSPVCRNCSTWGRITCAECSQLGHPSSHCPDLWRRYHNTLSENEPLVEAYKCKKNYQLYCSGCARRGHLVHTCRNSLPFSGLPINSPFVAKYLPLYRSTPDRYQNTSYGNQNYKPSEENKRFSQDPTTPKMSERNKRHSKSPTWHENHINKKRHMSTGDIIDEPQNMNSPIDSGKQVEETTEPKQATPQRSRTVSENKAEKNREENSSSVDATPDSAEKALDFIPISSANHDKRGQIIQDNEVSDTSDVVTSARIYVTNDITDKLKTKEGIDWLNDKMQKNNVFVTHSDVNLFLSIKGKLVDQEAFQNELRDWIQNPNNNKQQTVNAPQEVHIQSHDSDNIPKNRNNVLRKLSRAFESLKEDLGDPKSLFNKLIYLQENQAKLLKQKVISPQKLHNNKQHINEMLTKLNMVLLGQAGLADGSRHLRQLHSLQERLTNYRQKNLSVEIRKEIGEHYHSIFAATPRGDYRELVDRYYVARHSPNLVKKKKNKLPTQKKKNNFAPQANNKSQVVPNPRAENKVCLNNPVNKNMQNVRIKEYLRSLLGLRKRLLRIQPSDGVFKKAHRQLVRKMHTQIAALDNKSNITAKNTRKIKKLKQQAILFLQNNV